MVRTGRNYKKETAYEERPLQVKRRESRNRARAAAIRRGSVKKGDNKEVDHVGFHKKGTLARVRVRIVSRHKNRIRQPSHR